MTMTTYGGSFDIGRVVRRLFFAITQNWSAFLVSSALLVGIPSLVSIGGMQLHLLNQDLPIWALSIGGWFLTAIGNYVLQGVIVFTAVNGFNGKQTGLSESMMIGLRLVLPLIGLAVVITFGVFLGSVFFGVPGIILAIIWSVAAPVLVTEKRQVMESLKRSRDLTRGSRWLILVLMIAYLIFAWLFTLAINRAGAAAMGLMSSAGISPWMFAMVFSPILNIITSVVSSVGTASIYYELRTIKEGAAPESLAAIFD